MATDSLQNEATRENRWVLIGPDKARYELKPGSVVLGRSANCDIMLDSPRVSRRHAIIEFDGQTCTVYDEGSITGTFVEAGDDSDESRHQVGNRGYPLKPGDRLQIGDAGFTLVTELIGSEMSQPEQGSSSPKRASVEEESQGPKPIHAESPASSSTAGVGSTGNGPAAESSSPDDSVEPLTVGDFVLEKKETSSPSASASNEPDLEGILNNIVSHPKATESKTQTPRQMQSTVSRPIFSPLPDNSPTINENNFDNWLGWTITTIFGWAIGWFVACLGGHVGWAVAWNNHSYFIDPVSTGLFGLVLAVPLGLAQAMTLRKYVNFYQWWLLTIVGGTIGGWIGVRFGLDFVTTTSRHK